jgi:hypothetical protein
MERSKALLRNKGKLGMIVPISLVAIGDFSELRRVFFTESSTSHVLNFGVFPSKLFEGVAQRLSILIWARSPGTGIIYTTPYRRWYEAERPTLLIHTSFAEISCPCPGEVIPKIGQDSVILLEKINKVSGKLASLVRETSNHTLLYHRSPNNFIRAHTSAPYYRGAGGETLSKDHMRILHAKDIQSRDLLAVVTMSSMFFWRWEAVGNCRNLTESDILEFPFSDNTSLIHEASALADNLMKDMLLNSRRKVRHQKLTGDVEYDEFYVRESKKIIDQVDEALASHFGLSAEELDYILSYDIKYRLGKYDESL